MIPVESQKNYEVKAVLLPPVTEVEAETVFCMNQMPSLKAPNFWKLKRYVDLHRAEQ